MSEQGTADLSDKFDTLSDKVDTLNNKLSPQSSIVRRPPPTAHRPHATH